MPSHIKAFLLEASDGVSLSIAGKLKAEESLEIRRKCLSANIKDEFYAIGKSQAAIAQNVNDQLSSDKGSISADKQDHIMSEESGGGKRVEAGPKKRGLVRLILCTFFLYGALLGIAVNAARPNIESYGHSAFSAALGIVLLWSGAHGRLRWMRPLGITWIVFGVFTIPLMLNMQRVVSQRGGVFEGTAWLLVGGAFMVIVGGFLLFSGKKIRSAS